MGKTIPPHVTIKVELRIDHWERIVRDMQLGHDYVSADSVHHQTRGDLAKMELLRELAKSITDDITTLQTLLQLGKGRILGIEHDGHDD